MKRFGSLLFDLHPEPEFGLTPEEFSKPPELLFIIPAQNHRTVAKALEKVDRPHTVVVTISIKGREREVHLQGPELSPVEAQGVE